MDDRMCMVRAPDSPDATDLIEIFINKGGILYEPPITLTQLTAYLEENGNQPIHLDLGPFQTRNEEEHEDLFQALLSVHGMFKDRIYQLSSTFRSIPIAGSFSLNEIETVVKETSNLSKFQCFANPGILRKLNGSNLTELSLFDRVDLPIDEVEDVLREIRSARFPLLKKLMIQLDYSSNATISDICDGLASLQSETLQSITLNLFKRQNAQLLSPVCLPALSNLFKLRDKSVHFHLKIVGCTEMFSNRQRTNQLVKAMKLSPPKTLRIVHADFFSESSAMEFLVHMAECMEGPGSSLYTNSRMLLLETLPSGELDEEENHAENWQLHAPFLEMLSTTKVRDLQCHCDDVNYEMIKAHRNTIVEAFAKNTTCGHLVLAHGRLYDWHDLLRYDEESTRELNAICARNKAISNVRDSLAILQEHHKVDPAPARATVGMWALALGKIVQLDEWATPAHMIIQHLSDVIVENHNFSRRRPHA